MLEMGIQHFSTIVWRTATISTTMCSVLPKFSRRPQRENSEDFVVFLLAQILNVMLISVFDCQVKVVEYADRLEAKAKRKGRSIDIQAELEKYRQELLRVGFVAVQNTYGGE